MLRVHIVSIGRKLNGLDGITGEATDEYTSEDLLAYCVRSLARQRLQGVDYPHAGCRIVSLDGQQSEVDEIKSRATKLLNSKDPIALKWASEVRIL